MKEATIKNSLSEFCSKDEFKNHPDNPLKEAELNWLFKNRESNVFKSAFVKVNAKKYLVHIPSFTACLIERIGK